MLYSPHIPCNMTIFGSHIDWFSGYNLIKIRFPDLLIDFQNCKIIEPTKKDATNRTCHWRELEDFIVTWVIGDQNCLGFHQTYNWMGKCSSSQLFLDPICHRVWDPKMDFLAQFLTPFWCRIIFYVNLIWFSDM